jgi:hypothetical protein
MRFRQTQTNVTGRKAAKAEAEGPASSVRQNRATTGDVFLADCFAGPWNVDPSDHRAKRILVDWVRKESRASTRKVPQGKILAALENRVSKHRYSADEADKDCRTAAFPRAIAFVARLARELSAMRVAHFPPANPRLQDAGESVRRPSGAGCFEPVLLRHSLRLARQTTLPIHFLRFSIRLTGWRHHSYSSCPVFLWEGLTKGIRRRCSVADSTNSALGSKERRHSAPSPLNHRRRSLLWMLPLAPQPKRAQLPAVVRHRRLNTIAGSEPHRDQAAAPSNHRRPPSRVLLGSDRRSHDCNKLRDLRDSIGSLRCNRRWPDSCTRSLCRYTFGRETEMPRRREGC